jgi:glycosyltransferase involved in cell wall biosynthesis
MKLSIITVSLNDLHRFKKTYSNVIENLSVSENLNSVEYVVKTTDKSEESSYLNDIELSAPISVRILTDNDYGIYDAMNRAIDKALGSYVWFINSGDLIYNGAIDEVIPQLRSENYYRGKFLYNNKVIQQKDHFILKYSSLCHQAIISKREESFFDTTYELAADFLHFYGKSFTDLDLILCVYEDDVKEKEYSRQICEEKIQIFEKYETNPFLKFINILALKAIILFRYR